jgi:hypothetical protein
MFFERTFFKIKLFYNLKRKKVKKLETKEVNNVTIFIRYRVKMH